MKYCPNCGKELNEGAAICLSCGHLINPPQNQVKSSGDSSGKVLATLSVIFGSLGFYPLIFIGSIAGFVMALVVLASDLSVYKGRAKIGLGLSIGSFVMWILFYVFAFMFAWEAFRFNIIRY